MTVRIFEKSDFLGERAHVKFRIWPRFADLNGQHVKFGSFYLFWPKFEV